MKTQNFGTSTMLQMRAYGLLSATLRPNLLSKRPLASLKNYRENRENGDHRDNPQKPFPSAGFDTLDIKSSTYKPNGPKGEDFYPDKQGRHWLKLTLNDGRIIEDFYWTKDEVRGYPDKSDSDRYWFIIHHAPSGTKIEGFSQEPNREKGFPDKDKKYWYNIKYTECGAIKQWMEEKDLNYLRRLQKENPALYAQEIKTAPPDVQKIVAQEQEEQRRLAAEKEKLKQQAAQEEQQRRLAEEKRKQQTPLAAISAKDLSSLKGLSLSKETVWTDVDKEGNNVFHLAARKRSSKAFKLLLKSVPSATRMVLLRQLNHHDDTPLHLAARYCKADVVQALFKALDKNLKRSLQQMNERGYLPLHDAAEAGKIEVVQALLNAGADLKTLTEAGLSAQQCAEQKGHTMLAQLLASMNTPSAMPQPTPTTKKYAKTLYAFSATNANGLSFSQDEKFEILQEHPTMGWCEGRPLAGSQHGLIPMNFLALISPEEAMQPTSTPPVSGGKISSGADVNTPELPSSEEHRTPSSGGGSSGSQTPQRVGVGIDTQGMAKVDLIIPREDFTIGEILGKGGFGAVYRGMWHGEPVAIKQLLEQKLTPALEQDFRNEAGIMVQLRHPNIVYLYGISTKPYSMVMEFMSNGSLHSVLHSNQRLSWSLRYRISLDVAKGLAFLHRKLVLHRDLKSLNVLLDENCKAKLSDFGLSKIKLTSSDTYQSAGIAGTLQWIAPELLADDTRKYTQPCDVYSYGMLLWEILSRSIPYQDISNRALIPMRVIQGRREKIPAGSPASLATLTQQCWTQSPDDRPTMVTVVQALTENPVTDSIAPVQPSSIISGTGYGAAPAIPGSGAQMPFQHGIPSGYAMQQPAVSISTPVPSGYNSPNQFFSPAMPQPPSGYGGIPSSPQWSGSPARPQPFPAMPPINPYGTPPQTRVPRAGMVVLMDNNRPWEVTKAGHRRHHQANR
jgi:serine/threonine protein kinase